MTTPSPNWGKAKTTVRILDGVRIKTLTDRHCSTKCPLFHDSGTCALLQGTKWCLGYEFKEEHFKGQARYIRCKPCHSLERKGKSPDVRRLTGLMKLAGNDVRKLVGLLAPNLPDEAGLKGMRVYARGRKSLGIATGSSRPCRMEGCTGRCIMVRWRDGKVTWPCRKGMAIGPHGRSLEII